MRKKPIITLLSSTALAATLVGCSDEPTAVPPADLAIENVTVVDAVDGTREAQRVVVSGDTIVAVEPMSSELRPVRQTVDGTGRFLTPGLWDMHVHFLYEPALTDRMAPLLLRYGITSVRDTGGDLAQMMALRDRFAASGEPEPRLYFSGPLLDGRFVVYDGGDPGRPKLGTDVPDTKRAVARVNELAAAGAHFIKIYELVAPDVFETLASAARSRGLAIASHVPLMMTADAAGPLADSMEHLRNLELACAADWEALLAVRQARITGFVEGRGYDLRSSLHSLQRIPAIQNYDEARCDEVLDALAKAPTLQVPTLRLNTLGKVMPFNRPDWSEAAAGLPAEVRSAWLASAERIRRESPLADHTFSDWSLFLIARLKARQVPIAAGTDTPIGLGIPGYSLHTELELLVEGGLTPREALAAATVVPPTFFDSSAELPAMGTVAAGQAADLLLLEANPLVDISNTRRIVRVMSRGRWVD